MYHTRPLSKLVSRFKHGLIASAFIATQLIPFLAMGTASAAGTGNITVANHEGQLEPSGSWSNGNITTYKEGESINFRFDISGNKDNSGQMQVNFTNDGGGCQFFSNSFVLGAITNTSGASPTVTTVGSPVAIISGSNSGDWSQVLAVNFTNDGAAKVNYTLKLTNEAGNCSGSSQHSRLNNVTGTANGDFANIGALNVPVPAKDILLLPSITISKAITQGSAVASDFHFGVIPAINGQSTFAIPVGQTSVTIPNVNPDGSYVITESGPAGYKFTGGSGTPSCVVSQASIGTAAGQMTATVAAGKPATDATCNFTNTVNTGSIIIKKDAIPDSSQVFHYSTNGLSTDATGFDLTDDSTTGLAEKDFNSLAAGSTYTVSEDATSGWDFHDVTCAGATNSTVTKTDTKVSITLAANETVVCTYTNRERGTITVHKVTNPSTDHSNFSITASSTTGGTITEAATQTINNTADVVYHVGQGTYTVNEAAADGWAEDDSACTNLAVTSSNLNVNCTVTNTKLAKITIVKQTNPSSSAQAFSFTPSANLSGSDFSLDTDSSTATPGATSFANLVPGQTYSVSENSQSGWQLTGLTCSSGYTWNGSGSTVTLTPAAGDDITCTYTNTQLGSISGFKYDVNAGAVSGGDYNSPVQNWNVYLLVSGTVKSSTPTAANGSYSFSGLLPGSYTLAECQQDSDGCDGWTQVYGAAPVTLSAGDQVTNEDFGNFKNGLISGVKFNDHNGNGVNDDSDENLSGWTINLTGTTDSGQAVSATDVTDTNGYSFTNLAPGSYKVCEVGQTGWTQTLPGNNSCYTTVIDQSGQATTDDFGNQGRGTITVSKNLDNGFGTITNDVTGWTWNYSGTYGSASNNTASTTNQVTVPAGNYTISENEQTDYHFDSLSCNNIIVGGPLYTVTVPAGGSVSCTYTNVRDTGTLVIKKNVVNDNGGSKTYADFDFTVDGGTAQTFDADSNDTSNQDGIKTLTVVTGDYAVVEPNANTMGYATSYDNCSDASVTAGQTTVCTITNDDVAPLITVTKNVINLDGGTLQVSDFPLYVGNIQVTSGIQTQINLAGTYLLTEPYNSAYQATAWSGDCDSFGNIIMVVGGVYSCSITNDDIAPQLTVIKHVVNTNTTRTDTADDFTMNISGTNVSSPSFPGNENGTTVTLKAGDYNVTEDANSNYTVSYSADCDSSMQVGEHKTCTVTNTAILKPAIKVVKTSSTDNAYEGDSVTYTFTVTNTGNTPLGIDSVHDDVAGDGTYVSGDSNHNDQLDVGEAWVYTKDFTVPAGSNDITNTVEVCGSDVAEAQVCASDHHILHVYHPTISITKHVHTDAESDGGTFNLNIDGHTYATGGNGTSTDDVLVTPGTHTVAETGANGTDLSDYDSAIACYVGGDNNGTSQDNPSGLGTSLDDVTAQQDQHVHCNIYNVRHATLTIVKDAQPNDPQLFNFTLERQNQCVELEISDFLEGLNNEDCDGFSAVDNFQLVDNTDPSTASKTESLTAIGNFWSEQDGVTYRLSEAATAGWDLTNLNCGDVEANYDNGMVTLTLYPGQNVTCTYTNTKRASLTIAKDAQPNSLQMFNFTSDIDGAANFSLMDNGNQSTNRTTMTNLLPGTYTITESSADNWTLNGVECGQGVTMSLKGHTLSVTLAPGAQVTCTFTNAMGAVLGAVATPAVPQLVNTGEKPLVNFIIGFTALLLTVALTIAARRQPQN